MATHCTWITESLGGYPDRDEMAARVSKIMSAFNPTVVFDETQTAIAVAGYFKVGGPSGTFEVLPMIGAPKAPSIIIEEEGRVIHWDLATASEVKA